MTERLTEEFKDGRNILRKGIENIHHVGFGQFYAGEAIDKLSEYETAEEEGRLVVLPCKVGDAVHVLRQSWNGWNIDKKKFTYGMIGKFGKTVFLAREEAEKALKEMEEKQDE